MELIIHSGDNLQRVGLIDDYVSIIWNDKYYSAGDINIVVPLNNYNLSILKKNNFVSREDTKEIAIIETVTVTKTENGEKLINATGRMAQSLLGRRIVWDSTLLNGGTVPQIRALIDANLINPTDLKRTIPAGMEERAASGSTISWPGDEYTSGVINSIAANSVVRNWNEETYDVASGCVKFFPQETTSANVLNSETEQVIELEEAVTLETVNEAGTVTIGALYKNPITQIADTVERTASGTYAKYKRVQKNEVSNYISLLRTHIDASLRGSYHTHNAWQIGLKNNSIFDENSFFNYFRGRYVDGVLRLPIYEHDGSGRWVQVPSARVPARVNNYIVNKYVAYTDDTAAEEVFSRGYQAAVITESLSMDLQKEGLMWALLGYHVRFYSNNSTSSYATIIGPNGREILQPELIQGFCLTDINASKTTIDFSALPEKAETYKLLNNGSTSQGTMLITFSYLTGLTPFLALGTAPHSQSTIYEVIEGDNLEEFAEKNLQNIGIGIKSRYDEATRQIYIDVYAGEDRTTGQTERRPVLFSRNMDALLSYDVTESTQGKKNIIKVKGSIDDTTFYAEAGAGAGLTRQEGYQNINDVASYSGADYVQSLAKKGEISLNGFEQVIDAGIDATIYKYREQYNIGDVVTIGIDDFSLYYNVRVLEACESWDSTGFKLSLVLGV